MVNDIFSSLDDLTEALQELQKNKDEKTFEIPRSIPVSELVFLPDVREYLEEQRKYRELTRNVNVGFY